MKWIHLLMLTFLAGCVVGPNYEKPQSKAPDAFVAQQVMDSLSDSGKELSTNWWEGFEDDTLNTLVTQGLARNYQIKAAHAAVKQAKARVSLADSGDAFSISGGVDGDVQNRQSISNSSDRDTQGIGSVLGFALPLDIFGKTKRETQAAKANYEAAQFELRGIVLAVSADIVSQYLTLRGNQQQLVLLKESVTLQEKTLSLVRSRLSSGISPELDLQRAITSVENLRSRIPLLEQELQNSRNTLATLTGSYPGAYESLLKSNQSIPDYQALIPTVLPIKVLGTRPDIHQAEADLKAAIEGIGIAKAEFYPQFDLSGSMTLGLNSVTGSPSTTTLISALGGTINQFITDGGAREAGLAIAKAQAEERLAEYEQALREAIAEVETVLVAIHTSKERQVALQKAVNSSQRSFKQAETLYQQGLISFLDVVDAQRVWADARQNLARERTTYSVSISELFNALGTDVQENAN